VNQKPANMDLGSADDDNASAKASSVNQKPANMDLGSADDDNASAKASSVNQGPDDDGSGPTKMDESATDKVLIDYFMSYEDKDEIFKMLKNEYHPLLPVYMITAAFYDSDELNEVENEMYNRYYNYLIIVVDKIIELLNENKPGKAFIIGLALKTLFFTSNSNPDLNNAITDIFNQLDLSKSYRAEDYDSFKLLNSCFSNYTSGAVYESKTEIDLSLEILNNDEVISFLQETFDAAYPIDLIEVDAGLAAGLAAGLPNVLSPVRPTKSNPAFTPPRTDYTLIPPGSQGSQGSQGSPGFFSPIPTNSKPADTEDSSNMIDDSQKTGGGFTQKGGVKDLKRKMRTLISEIYDQITIDCPPIVKEKDLNTWDVDNAVAEDFVEESAYIAAVASKDDNKRGIERAPDPPIELEEYLPLGYDDAVIRQFVNTTYDEHKREQKYQDCLYFKKRVLYLLIHRKNMSEFDKNKQGDMKKLNDYLKQNWFTKNIQYAYKSTKLEKDAENAKSDLVSIFTTTMTKYGFGGGNKTRKIKRIKTTKTKRKKDKKNVAKTKRKRSAKRYRKSRKL